MAKKGLDRDHRRLSDPSSCSDRLGRAISSKMAKTWSKTYSRKYRHFETCDPLFPNLLQTPLPMSPLAPKTVATVPEKEDRYPGPFFMAANAAAPLQLTTLPGAWGRRRQRNRSWKIAKHFKPQNLIWGSYKIDIKFEKNLRGNRSQRRFLQCILK